MPKLSVLSQERVLEGGTPQIAVTFPDGTEDRLILKKRDDDHCHVNDGEGGRGRGAYFTLGLNLPRRRIFVEHFFVKNWLTHFSNYDRFAQ